MTSLYRFDECAKIKDYHKKTFFFIVEAELTMISYTIKKNELAIF